MHLCHRRELENVCGEVDCLREVELKLGPIYLPVKLYSVESRVVAEDGRDGRNDLTLQVGGVGWGWGGVVKDGVGKVVMSWCGLGWANYWG